MAICIKGVDDFAKCPKHRIAHYNHREEDYATR